MWSSAVIPPSFSEEGWLEFCPQARRSQRPHLFQPGWLEWHGMAWHGMEWNGMDLNLFQPAWLIRWLLPHTRILST